MQSKKVLILLVGESGSGKTTVANKLSQQYGLTSVASYTTREKRTPKENGHIFVTKKEFSQLNDLIAYTYFDGNHYGATQEQVKNNDIFVIDPSGIQYFFQHYTGSKIPVVVYLKVSETERLRRMIDKGDALEKVVERIQHDKRAFANIEQYSDFIIDHDDVNYIVNMVLDIVIWTEKVYQIKAKDND